MSKDSRAKRELHNLQEMNSNVVPYELWPDDIKDYNQKQTCKKLQALNQWHDQYISALRHDEHVVGIGPAGTGKTFIAAAVAAELLTGNHINQIIMTRPPVECGEKMGFLPGTIMEKYEPYIAPFYEGLGHQLGKVNVQKMIEDKRKLYPTPLNYVRGRTFDNAVILLDEAQNIDVVTMKAILTRVGKNCRLFITGDIEQTDLKLKPGEVSGLEWWVERLRQFRPEVEIVDFTSAPCVRSDHCAWILDVFKKSKSKSKSK